MLLNEPKSTVKVQNKELRASTVPLFYSLSSRKANARGGGCGCFKHALTFNIHVLNHSNKVRRNSQLIS